MAHMAQRQQINNQQSSAFKIRKANKPLMEKKRRERINRCLTELKQLVLEATRKSNTHYSKLEKADILELTVKYLRTVQRDQMTRAALVDPTVMTRYRLGFTECAAEVARYVSSDSPQNKLQQQSPGENGDQTGQRLVEHLSNCKMGLDAAATTGMIIAAEQQQQVKAEPAPPPPPPSNEQLLATLAQCILQQKQQQFLSAFSIVTSPQRSNNESSSSSSSPVPTSSSDQMTPALNHPHHSPLTPSPSTTASSSSSNHSISLTVSPPSPPQPSLIRNQIATSGVWRPW